MLLSFPVVEDTEYTKYSCFYYQNSSDATWGANPSYIKIFIHAHRILLYDLDYLGKQISTKNNNAFEMRDCADSGKKKLLHTPITTDNNRKNNSRTHLSFSFSALLLITTSYYNLLACQWFCQFFSQRMAVIIFISTTFFFQYLLAWLYVLWCYYLNYTLLLLLLYFLCVCPVFSTFSFLIIYFCFLVFFYNHLASFSYSFSYFLFFITFLTLFLYFLSYSLSLFPFLLSSLFPFLLSSFFLFLLSILFFLLSTLSPPLSYITFFAGLRRTPIPIFMAAFSSPLHLIANPFQPITFWTTHASSCYFSPSRHCICLETAWSGEAVKFSESG